MYYLYKGLAKRPFSQSSNSHGSSDDEDVGDDILDRTDKKKRGTANISIAPKGVGARTLSSASSSSRAAAHDGPVTIVDLDADEVIAKPAATAAANSGTKSAPAVAAHDDEEVLIDADADFNDPIYSSAKTLLAKVKASQSKVYGKKTTEVDLLKANALAQADDVFDLTRTHTIKSAAERIQEATQKSAQINKPKPKQPEIITNAAAPPTAAVHIKVRVNGKLESTHDIGVEETFAKLITLVNAHYGLPQTTKLSLEFDGEGVGMRTTPSSLDMDEGDDYLVDAKVDVKTFDLMKANKGK